MASDLILNYTKFDYKTVMSPFTGERQRNQEPSIGNYRDITIDKNNTATIKYYTERDKYKWVNERVRAYKMCLCNSCVEGMKTCILLKESAKLKFV